VIDLIGKLFEKENKHSCRNQNWSKIKFEKTEFEVVTLVYPEKL